MNAYKAFCHGCQTGYKHVPVDRICVICQRDVTVRAEEKITCPWCGMRFSGPLYRNGVGWGEKEAFCPICLGRLRMPLTAQKYKADRKPSKTSERYPWLSEKTARLLIAIAERDEWTCGICRKIVDWKIGDPRKRRPTLDHIFPRSKGGKNVRENLQLAHSDCNNRKGNDVAGENPRGLAATTVKEGEWPF